MIDFKTINYIQNQPILYIRIFSKYITFLIDELSSDRAHTTSYFWLDDSPITKEVLAHFDCCKRSLVKITGTLGTVFLAQQPPQSIFDPSSGVVSRGTRSRGSRRTARWRWGTCRSRGSRRARWACPPAPGWRRLVLQLTSSPLFPNGRQRAWKNVFLEKTSYVIINTTDR